MRSRFLVGQIVHEVRYGNSLRLVFEPGENVAPWSYAALEEPFTYERKGSYPAEIREGS